MIRFKEAELKDALFIYQVSSDEKVRKFFRNPKGFSLLNHMKWLEGYKGKISIIYSGNKRIGLIRECKGEITTIISPDFQGKGFGSLVIKTYTKNRKGLTAEIDIRNKASKKVYEKAGFKFVKSLDENVQLYRK